MTSLELQTRLTKPDVSDSDAKRCFAHAQFDSILAEYLVDVVVISVNSWKELNIKM